MLIELTKRRTSCGSIENAKQYSSENKSPVTMGLFRRAFSGCVFMGLAALIIAPNICIPDVMPRIDKTAFKALAIGAPCTLADDFDSNGKCIEINLRPIGHMKQESVVEAYWPESKKT